MTVNHSSLGPFSTRRPTGSSSEHVPGEGLAEDNGVGVRIAIRTPTPLSSARPSPGTCSDEDPVGRRVLKGPNDEWFTVIGVARDVRNAGLAKSADPEYYVVRKA